MTLIKKLTDKLQAYYKIIGLLIFFAPIIVTGIKKSIPYFYFVAHGPELVTNVEELKQSLLVANGALSANSVNVDSVVYKANWRGHEYTARLKRMKSGDVYAFLQNGELGERCFIASCNKDKTHWYFIDFDGVYVKLEK